MLLNQLPSDQAAQKPAEHGKNQDKNYPARRRIILDVSVDIALLHPAGNRKTVIGIPEKPDGKQVYPLYNRLETVQAAVRRFGVIPFHRMISAKIPTTINHGSKNQLPIIRKTRPSSVMYTSETDRLRMRFTIKNRRVRRQAW